FTGTEVFQYTISDGNGGTDTANVTVTVGQRNSEPDAVDDSSTATQGEKTIIDVLGNDTDPENDVLTITTVSNPTNGTAVVTGDGKISYTPNAGFTGTEVFQYTISDNNGGTDTANVTVTVGEGNKTPDAIDDSTTTTQGQKVVVDALGNDTDQDGDTLTITSIANPTNGTAVITGDGKISYTPNADFTGTETFEYTISDGNGGTDTANVTVEVGSDNKAPEAVDDSASAEGGEKVVVDVLGNDTDPNGDDLTITNVADPEHGTAVITGDGKISYTPDVNFNGTESFEYTISDGNGGTDTATVVVDVNKDSAKASIVGDNLIKEGRTGTYSVQLDHAVGEDTFYTIEISDGTANRVDHSGAGQDIMWGGFWTYGAGREQHGTIPLYNYRGTPTRESNGPDYTTWDYTVNQDGSINTGNTITVKIEAGQTSSSEFTIDAWKEKVAFDLDLGKRGREEYTRDFKESTETFDLDIISTTGSASDIELDSTHLDVSIKDRTKYWVFSPIALDLNGDGVQTIALGDSEGRFDMLNNGKPIESGWLSGNDAFLAIDTNGNGTIDDRAELFGGGIGDGFAKLATYDSNNDGVVNAQDDNFSDLRVWQDRNENHQTDEGELISLDEAGIESLDVDFINQYAEQEGNVLLERGNATSSEGESIDMVDVYFNMAPTAEELEGADISLDVDFSEFLVDNTNEMDALLGQSVEVSTVPTENSNTATNAMDDLQQLANLQDQESVHGY
ncbi:MAG: tandem-95 repeat protein, partial [Methylococcales bacterium]|nr:tandem-95 repeat protein [Methylococcales bacterium]